MLAFDRRAARITWTVFLVAAAIGVVYAVRRTLLVFFLAIFFSYMLFPLVKRIEPMIPPRHARLVATTLVFVLLAVAVTVLLALIGPPLAGQASHLAARIPQVVNDPHLFDRVPLPDWLAPYRERMAEFVREHLPDSDSAVPIAKQRRADGAERVRRHDLCRPDPDPRLPVHHQRRGDARQLPELDRRGPPLADVAAHRRRPRQALRPLHPCPGAAVGGHVRQLLDLLLGRRRAVRHRPRRHRRGARVHPGDRPAGRRGRCPRRRGRRRLRPPARDRRSSSASTACSRTTCSIRR